MTDTAIVILTAMIVIGIMYLGATIQGINGMLFTAASNAVLVLATAYIAFKKGKSSSPLKYQPQQPEHQPTSQGESPQESY